MEQYYDVIGGEEYTINHIGSAYEVREHSPYLEHNYWVKYRGRYAECMKWLDDLRDRCADYELNL